MSDALDRLIDREGGFVNDPHDRGGATKFGITRHTLAWWRQRDVSVDDVADLTREEARAIYDRRYWRGPRIAELPEALGELLLDCATLHGVKRAVLWLQFALRKRGAVLDADGVIGPRTLDAVSRADVEAVRREIVRERLVFVGRLISIDPSQARFAHGWLRRIAAFV